MAAAPLKESIHILGAGSIGCLFASSIRSKFPNYPVTLLFREERRGRLGNSKSIDIQWKPHSSHAALGDTRIQVPVEFIQKDDESQQLPRIQNLVVTTKSYQALSAIQSVLSRLNSSASPASNHKIQDTHTIPRIILLCNGALAVKEEVQTYFDKQSEGGDSSTSHANMPQLVLATTTHGAYKQDASETNQQYVSSPSLSFVHAGYGQTFIEDSASDVGNLWDDAGLNCSMLASEAMNALLWKKLAVNCVINPLTAIYRCTNGELLLEPSFPELQQDILQEVAQVAAAATDSACKLDSTASTMTTPSPSVDELRAFVAQVIRDTHANKSSMCQDIANNQRTEIDHLNGYIVRKGRELKLECPTNEDICQRIQELQQPALENEKER